jgi:hypothetical protein
MRKNQILNSLQTTIMEQLLFYLKHLACPQFLLPRDDLIVSSRFRNNLLIWLHAVYSKPSLRIVQDESWTKHEGEPTDILKWIQLMVFL